jgi:hypothetical protein
MRLATHAAAPSLQARLEIGAADDPAEHEAERVAAAVVSTGDAAPAPHVGAAPAAVARCADCTPGRPCPRCQEEARARGEAIPIQARPAGGGALALPASTGRYVSTLPGRGQPLPPAERGFFERRFGRDFGGVRVHTDGEAAQSAAGVRAQAYTVGSHIVFGAGRWQPGSAAGRHLIAHELTHTVQQAAGGARLNRQCDPGWATLPWSDRVANVRRMAAGAARNQCMADMMDEALYPNVTVEERTNTARSVAAAMAANRYVEWGSVSDVHVNFDQNLNRKQGNRGLFGEATFRTTATPSSIAIFIILGPDALNPVGPQFTRMAFDHEYAHASQFLLDHAMRGSAAHAATPGDELRIYAEGFSSHFLNVWTIDNTPPGRFSLATDWSPMFGNYTRASAAERQAAVDSIRMFYDVRCVGIVCNTMKFRIWLQSMLNALPAGHALADALNAFPGMALTRGTPPATHFSTAAGCT